MEVALDAGGDVGEVVAPFVPIDAAVLVVVAEVEQEVEESLVRAHLAGVHLRVDVGGKAALKVGGADGAGTVVVKFGESGENDSLSAFGNSGHLVKIGYELNYKVTLLHSFLAALLRFFLQALTWRGTVHLRLLLDANLHFRVQALELGASQELRNSNESAESVKSKHIHNDHLQ